MNVKFFQGRRAFPVVIVGAFSVAIITPSHAAEVVVKTAVEAKTAFADSKPGDTITLQNGDYDLGQVIFTRVGTDTTPFVVRAQKGGKVRLIGKTGFVFRRAAHITINGFDFATEDVSPIEISGSHHVRITDNRFHIKEPGGKGAFRWVRINSTKGDDSEPAIISHHNRIDHNLFEEKHTIGNFLAVDGTTIPYPKAQISQYDRIDHNYFRNIGPRVPNGMEAIRVGLAGTSLSSGFTVIEDNLFENCDGDPEVISIKTSDAVVRNNTFRACEGGLCLRHGNRNRVEGNLFLGDGKNGSNGIRMYGDDHVIEGNYLFGLTSFALTVSNGSADYGADYTKGEPLPVARPDDLLRLHLRPRRITLRKNVIVDCAEAIVLGAPYGLPLPQKTAQDIRFDENTVFASKNPEAKLIWIGNAPEHLTWSDNVLYAGKNAETGLPATIPAKEFKIVREDNPSIPKKPSHRLAEVGPSWLK